MDLGNLIANQVNVDTIKTKNGGTYVLDLDNMPNQGTDGYVLTAQGVGNAPIWEDLGSVSVPWTAVPSSINPSDDNTYGLGSGSHAWQGLVAYTVYRQMIITLKRVEMQHSMVMLLEMQTTQTLQVTPILTVIQ